MIYKVLSKKPFIVSYDTPRQIEKDINKYYENINNLDRFTLKEHERYFKIFMRYTPLFVETYNDISKIEAGSIVGVYENEELKKVFIIPHNKNNKYVKFNECSIKPDKFGTRYLHVKNVNDSYFGIMIKYDDFTSLLNNLVRDNIIVDISNISFSVYKTNVAKKMDTEFIYDYDVYFFNSNSIKCADYIINDSMKKLFQDEYEKYKIELQLHGIRESITKFMAEQTSFDNVSKYKAILDVIN